MELWKIPYFKYFAYIFLFKRKVKVTVLCAGSYVGYFPSSTSWQSLILLFWIVFIISLYKLIDIIFKLLILQSEDTNVHGSCSQTNIEWVSSVGLLRSRVQEGGKYFVWLTGNQPPASSFINLKCHMCNSHQILSKFWELINFRFKIKELFFVKVGQTICGYITTTYQLDDSFSYKLFERI